MENTRINQSSIGQHVLRYLQQNQDKTFSATDIILHAEPNVDPTPEAINLVKSYLKGMVVKDQLKQEYKSDPTTPDFFFLESYQKHYWNRKQWKL